MLPEQKKMTKLNRKTGFLHRHDRHDDDKNGKFSK